MPRPTPADIQNAQTRLTKNAAEFSTKVQGFTKRLRNELLPLFVSKIAMQILRGVVLKTPVDTGRARANWQVSVGHPSMDVIDPTTSGSLNSAIALAQAQTNAMNALAIARPFEPVFVSNNVAYIGVLEAGSSSQAPNGMLALTIAEVSQQFR